MNSTSPNMRRHFQMSFSNTMIALLGVAAIVVHVVGLSLDIHDNEKIHTLIHHTAHGIMLIVIMIMFAFFGALKLKLSKQIRQYKAMKNKYAQLSVELKQGKEREEELTKTRQWFEDLLEHLPIGIMLLDQNKRIIHINKEGLRLIKNTEERVIGTICHDTVCPTGKGTCPVLDIGETVDKSERKIVTADGTLHPIMKSIIKVHLDGQLYLLEAIVDIKPLKEAEQQLIEERNLFQNYLDIAGVIIIALDTDGCVTLINKEGCEILGYSYDEIIGTNWFQRFLPASNKEQLASLYNEHIKKGVAFDEEENVPYEASIITRTGVERSIRWYTTILKNEEGVITGVLSSGTDITDIKRMEEELLNSRKLESIGILAGGIAHDFNNLLTAILGNISLANLDVEENSTLASYLNNAKKASHQAQALAQQLLTFARGGKPIRKNTSVANLVRECAEFILKGTNVKAECFIESDLLSAEVDSNQFSQVVNNLIINAMQAMPSGGTIFILGENVLLSDGNEHKLPAGQYIHFSFHDEGKGIEDQDFSKIFDPYFTTKEKGNGLGLTTSYSVIKKHDGIITAESLCEVGTIFHIYIPASNEALPEPTYKSIALPKLLERSTPHKRALIMDDEPTIRDVMKNMLEKLGYSAVCTIDGEAAIEAYNTALNSQTPFDVTIMDLTIPGAMGGKEAIKHLKHIDPNIIAIVSSGYSDDPVMAHYRQHGFSAVLKKPIEIEELNEALHQVMTSR